MKKRFVIVSVAVISLITAIGLYFVVFSVSWRVCGMKTASMPEYLFDLELYSRYNDPNEKRFFIDEAEGSDIKQFTAKDYLLVNIVVQCESRVPGLLWNYVGAFEPRVVLKRVNLPERLVYCDDSDGSDSSFTETDAPCSILLFFYVKGLSREEADEYVRNVIPDMNFVLVYTQKGFGAREQDVRFTEKDVELIRSE